MNKTPMPELPKGKHRSIVVVTGERLDGGEPLKMELPLDHDPGAPDSGMFGFALKTVRETGGMLKENEDGSMTFYPFAQLKSVHLQVNRLQLALSGLSVVQH